MPHSPEESDSPKLKRVVGEKTGALSPEDSVQTAGERMRSVDANFWPVAEDHKLVGAIDHPDPDRKAGGHGHDPTTTRVGETMRHDAPFCYEDEDSAAAQRKMEEHNLNHLPVVDREMRIVGIISRVEAQAAVDPMIRDEAASDGDWQPGSGQSENPVGQTDLESAPVDGDRGARERFPAAADGAEAS